MVLKNVCQKSSIKKQHFQYKVSCSIQTFHEDIPWNCFPHRDEEMSARVEGGVILEIKFPVSHIYTRRARLYMAYIIILNQSERFQRVYLKDKLTFIYCF